MVGHLKFEQFLKGIKRLKSRPADKHLPITPFVPSRICGVLDRWPHDKDNIMFWAACCLGFFAFLRSGEFTVPSLASFDPSRHLTTEVDDVANPSMLFVYLKSSKCDQSRLGVTLCMGKTDSHLCQVAAILVYMAVRGTSPGPLFVFQDATPLTQSELVSCLRSTLAMAGLDCSNYSGHSFRIGAATTAAASGLRDAMIQTLGKWSSDSYKRYIRLSPQELASYSRSHVERR